MIALFLAAQVVLSSDWSAWVCVDNPVPPGYVAQWDETARSQSLPWGPSHVALWTFDAYVVEIQSTGGVSGARVTVPQFAISIPKGWPAAPAGRLCWRVRTEGTYTVGSSQPISPTTFSIRPPEGDL